MVKHGYGGAFVLMKRRLVVTVIFLLIMCLTLSACSVSFPLNSMQLDMQPEITFRIYVSGAVERDGYYEVNAGTSYLDLFQLAGILPETYLPLFYTNLIDGTVTYFILDYYNDGVYESTNVNGGLISMRLNVKGLSSHVVNKLADYLEQYGTIHNRQHLSLALGDDYDDNYYKLFIAEDDYEKAY